MIDTKKLPNKVWKLNLLGKLFKGKLKSALFVPWSPSFSTTKKSIKQKKKNVELKLEQVNRQLKYFPNRTTERNCKKDGANTQR